MAELPLTGANTPHGSDLPSHAQRPPDRPVYTPPGGPPTNTSVNRAIHAHMGDDNIRLMISDFYDALVASPIAHLFPTTPEKLAESKDRSATFFIFLLGGEPLYQRKYGPPMMRARHLPFAIDEAARTAWLACFDQILDEAPAKYGFPEEHLPGFRDFLHKFSTWMVNARSEGTA